ncbi:MAG: DUF418 domain-containing protein, partial [Thermoleophilia bacterium]|nr:DUF418 domain-containing protein [Thermoleophilia bacterium]
MSSSKSIAPAPTTRRERHRLVDALRGFALLGILVVNTEFFFQPIPVGWDGYDGPGDIAARWIVAAFFQAKFYLLFSLLFGYGLSIQLDRAARSGSDLRPRYLRRMAGLLVLGAAHAVLLFVGDILFLYALVGTAAYALRHASTGRLVRIGVTVYAVSSVFWLLVGLAAVLVDPAPATASAESVRIYTDGGLSEVVGEHFREWLEIFPAILVAQGPSAFALLLIGVALARGDWLSSADRHRALAKRILLVATPVGVAGGAVAATLSATGSTGGGAQTLGFAVQFTFAPALTAAYVAALMLLLGPRPPRAFAWLEAGGRMSLTVYLSQSIIATTLAYSYGAGLF